MEEMMQRNRYEMLTDENLIEELRGGDSAITDFIMNKYKPMVRKKARAMFLLGGENEDLIQEGMIGLLKQSVIMRPGREHPLQALPNCVSQGRCTVRSRHLRERSTFR